VTCNSFNPNKIKKTRNFSPIPGCVSGRKCRDTFTSLKKTRRKFGVSFWQYLYDRICGGNKVPKISDLIRQQILSTGQPPIYSSIISTFRNPFESSNGQKKSILLP